MTGRGQRGLRIATTWLVYCREMRDQLRDRRTLFTILVLPLILYPLLGSLLLQVSQFSRSASSTVCVVNAGNLPDDLPFVDQQGKVTASIAKQTDGMRWFFHPENDTRTHEQLEGVAEGWVRDGVFDVAVLVKPLVEDERVPQFKVLYSVASDASRAGYDRLLTVFGTLQQDAVASSMARQGIDPGVLEPFAVRSIDIAPPTIRDTAFWSKMLPFVMLIWALTGAFYPAIDLVAGEKERGTLETLLCSPALRSEIVLGKLAAVTTFSVMTSVLNVVSMLFTGLFVSKQFASSGIFGGAIGVPPLAPMLWLLVALLPLSALFSALALAVASMARSSKEGQYYLMPLMMVALPLVMLPMLPGNELSPGTSLIPVTGMFLLSRTLIEGQYLTALAYLPMVAGVTFGCLWLATRWAGRQFEDESVLFGGGDQWSMSSWMRSLWRDRQMSASTGQAYGCAAIILIALFFAKLVISEMPIDFSGIAKLVTLPQIGLVLAPTLLMACVLTRSMRLSLGLRVPKASAIPVAVLLAISFHPLYVTLGQVIQYCYPLSDQAQAALLPFEQIVNGAPFWQVVIVLAIVPSICEELAFRGFIFSGLLHNNGKFRAVLVSAILFGFSHGILQQSLAATVFGILLGWITLRTRSLIPALIIHALNNTLSLSLGRVGGLEQPWVGYVYEISDGDVAYTMGWTVAAGVIAIGCLAYYAFAKPIAEIPLDVVVERRFRLPATRFPERRREAVSLSAGGLSAGSTAGRLGQG